MDVHKIYEYALEREREGYDFFKSNAERVSHASAVEIFERLAAEEQKHIQFIEGRMRALDGEAETSTSVADMQAGDFFSGRAEAENLEQTIIESMVPDLPVLRMAYLIEHDLSEFYEMAAAQTEGEVKEALAMLARWERGHEELFKGLHDRILKEYMQMPWGG
jgi:rubrerythrin